MSSKLPSLKRVPTTDPVEDDILTPPCRNNPVNSRIKAPWYSWATWQFMYNLLKIGKKRPLVEDDIDLLASYDTSKVLLERFNRAWKQEENSDKISLKNVLFYTITPFKVVMNTLLIIIYYSATIVSLICMNRILVFIENKSDKNETNNQNIRQFEAYLFGIGMICGSLTIAFLHHYLFYEFTRNGVALRTALTSKIFEKSLRISYNSVPISQVINLMSNDSQRFEELMKFLPFIFVAPIAFIVGTVVLSSLVNSYIPLFGVVLVFLFIPVQIYFSSKFGKLRDQAVLYTDNRIKLINQVLTGFLVMKMYCWEKTLLESVRNSRNLEIKYIKRAAMIKAFNFTFFFISNSLVGLIIFLPYYYINNNLKASIIFPIMTFFIWMKYPIMLFIPNIIQFLSEAKISIKRLEQFLNSPELKDSKEDFKNSAKYDPNIKPLIEMHNCSFSWDEIPTTTLSVVLTSKKEGVNKDISNMSSKYLGDKIDTLNKITLDNINLKLEGNNQCIIVIGKIGCGKSSLLNAIINEIPLVNSEQNKSYKNVLGNISYASQKSWIFNGSVRDNILFGNDFDPEWFDEVINACCLFDDIKQLAHNEYTIIGERGINLSGGQKSRVNLARAIYNKSNIILLDDPLSAVDSVVANNIFYNCFDINNNKNCICKDRLIILVTHQTQFLNRCYKIIVMEDGKIKYFDTYNKLLELGVNIKSLVEQYEREKSKTVSASTYSHTIENVEEVKEIELDEIETKPLIKLSDVKLSNTSKTIRNLDDFEKESKNIKKLAKKESIIVKEKLKTDGISLRVYKSLFDPTIHNNKISGDNNKNKSCCDNLIVWFKLSYILIIMFSGQILMTLSEYWLGLWANDSNNQDSNRYPIIYVTLTVCAFLIVSIRSTTTMNILLNGAKSLHDSMFYGVLYAPMEFFESNPIGRILNRFSKDQYGVDERLPEVFYDSLQNFGMALVTFILVSIANIYLIFILIPLITFFIWARNTYLVNSRVLKRLDGNTRSHIFEHFGILLNGLDIVRSYNKQGIMMNKCLDMIDKNTRMYLTFQQSSRWIGCTLDLSVSVLLFCTLFITITMSNNSTNIGIALMYMVTLSGLLQWVVRQFAEVDNHMTSVERIMEYVDLPIEGEKKKNNKISIKNDKNNWLTTGTIEFKNVSASYRTYLPNVLKSLNFKINHGEKIGIVGRTGSGKSTLFLTIFRLLEINDGSILISNTDISGLTLHSLRHKMSIIPQDPVLFSETIRYNIDPFNKYSDKDIISTLKIVQLYELIKSLPNGLYTNMLANGNNFSFGQKQLFCIARVLLNKDNLILLIDEATSNVDNKTDKLIQDILKKYLYKNKTVLTIAHRLNTILDSDKILVLDNGNIIEFDNPKVLLSKEYVNKSKNPLFYKMYQQAIIHSKQSNEQKVELEEN